jgi:hypothetical protein
LSSGLVFALAGTVDVEIASPSPQAKNINDAASHTRPMQSRPITLSQA